MQKRWALEYYTETKLKSSIERWFDQLALDQLKAITRELKLLEECGNRLRLPHSRALGTKLFELRERRYGYRVYYTFYKLKTIIILAVGDKTSQERDIKLARKRLMKLSSKQGKLYENQKI